MTAFFGFLAFLFVFGPSLVCGAVIVFLKIAEWLVVGLAWLLTKLLETIAWLLSASLSLLARRLR